jgi:hypothetical protein
MLARAISEYGPLWWKAASVSVKLTKQYRGSGSPPSHTSRAWTMPVWSMRDDTSYDFSGRTNRSVENGSSSAPGGRASSPPVRSTSNVE